MILGLQPAVKMVLGYTATVYGLTAAVTPGFRGHLLCKTELEDLSRISHAEASEEEEGGGEGGEEDEVEGGEVRREGGRGGGKGEERGSG